MAKKVEAWKTDNGMLFHNEEDALKYEKGIENKKSISKIFNENIPIIIQHIKDDYSREGIGIPDEIEPSYNGGWECESKLNPIKYCIYDWRNSDETCVYCGQPEERK